VEDAQTRIESWSARYEREVPENIREQIDDAIAQGSEQLTSILESVGRRSLEFVFSTLSSLIGYVSVPFFVFYMLKDRDRAFGRVYSWFPQSIRADVRECVRIANQTLGAYVRGQLFLGFIIFAATFVGLSFMGVEFALGLAFVAGVTELVPIIGPLIGFVPALIVVLATEPDKWWWVVLFYLGLQAAENYLLVPRVHSASVNIHPALILVLLAVGGALWGIWGVLIIVPIVAAIRDVFAYIHGRLVEAERDRLAAANVAVQEALPEPEPPPAEPEPAG
jgi:predicted PurR-regulated permease PerM